MGLIERIRQWRDARREGKAAARTEKLALQIVRPASVRDFGEIKRLLDKYRHSPSVTRRMTEHLAASDLIRTPGEAAGKGVRAMMESLKSSDYALMAGTRLAHTPTESICAIHRIIAMHTFMLDEYGSTYGKGGMSLPEQSEVYSAKRILNECLRDRNGNELAMLAAHGREPSEYVKRRYCLHQAYSPPGHPNPEENLKRILSARAAEILETEFSDNLPGDFVLAMKHDRQILYESAAQPASDRYRVIRAPCNRLDPIAGESLEERQVRIAKAYMYLDMRIYRMTGDSLMLPSIPFMNNLLFADAFKNKNYPALCHLAHLNRENVPQLREWSEKISGAPFLRDVVETENPALYTLVSQLNATCYGRETGIVPDGKAREVQPLHLINAYHTVMRHEHSLHLGRKNLPLPSPEELQAAVGVLDRVRRGDDREELRRTAAGKDGLSDYVKVRYGLSLVYRKMEGLLRLREREMSSGNLSSAVYLKKKADRIEGNIRQAAGHLAQGISAGNVPDNPLAALLKDKELLDTLANRPRSGYAGMDRIFLLKYGLSDYFDTLGKIEQRRAAEPGMKEHLDFLTSQQVKMIRFEASHQGEGIGFKLENLEYKRRQEAEKLNGGMKGKRTGGRQAEKEPPPKHRKPTFKL
mgnify:FL=1